MDDVLAAQVLCARLIVVLDPQDVHKCSSINCSFCDVISGWHCEHVLYTYEVQMRCKYNHLKSLPPAISKLVDNQHANCAHVVYTAYFSPTVQFHTGVLQLSSYILAYMTHWEAGDGQRPWEHHGGASPAAWEDEDSMHYNRVHEYCQPAYTCQ